MTYVEFCKECEQYIEHTNYPLEVFYRGQACDWVLKSTLQRKKEELEKETHEKVNVSDLFLENVNWNEKVSLFENIAHMQHYNRPTRLLDYTMSMDVALYFACEEEKYMNIDGVVYCCSYQRRNCELSDVKIMMEIANLQKPIKVDEFAKGILNKYSGIEKEYPENPI